MNADELTLETILDLFAEKVADRIAEKLAAHVAAAQATVYTTHKNGPHIPGKSRRWMIDHARLMPGARKAGRDWEIDVADYQAWRSRQPGYVPPAKAPTKPRARAALRRRRSR